MVDGRVTGAYDQIANRVGAWSIRTPWQRRQNKIDRPPGILKPFAQPKRRWYMPGRSWFLVPLLLLFCLIYGFAFAVLVPFIVVPFAIPPMILLLLIIWAMPDAAAPVR